MATRGLYKVEKSIFDDFGCGFFEKIEYIGIESATQKRKKEDKMRSIEEQLERVKRSLEKSLAELEKIHEAELAMRELCAYELETIKR